MTFSILSLSIKLLNRFEKIIFQLGAIILFLGFHTLTYALDTAKEYEIKAVYLLNLGNFIKWTPDSLQSEKTFQICVVGHDPFGADLDFVVQTQKEVQGYQVVIRRLSSSAPLTACHILFMSHSEQLHWSNIFAKVKHKPVLTVGDGDNFIIEGGMIQFYNKDGKIRLMLDPQTIRESGLKASAQLMQLALRIEHKGK